jgi:hypothetical protein
VFVKPPNGCLCLVTSGSTRARGGAETTSETTSAPRWPRLPVSQYRTRQEPGLARQLAAERQGRARELHELLRQASTPVQ